jgi:hypothetical protein
MNARLQGRRERVLTNAGLRGHFVDHRGSLYSASGRLARLVPIRFGTCRGGAAGHSAEASLPRRPVSTWP